MGHDAVLRSLRAALASPELQSVKLNVVVVKGLNDHEVLDFVEMTRESRLSVRFIEFMPFTGTRWYRCLCDMLEPCLFLGNRWDQRKMVPSAELLARIRAQHPTLRRGSNEFNDTARTYIIPGYSGTFGFISSMSDHFCGSCNRLRLTADGQIKVRDSSSSCKRHCARALYPLLGMPFRRKGDITPGPNACGRGRRSAPENDWSSCARQKGKARGDGGHRCCDEQTHDPHWRLSTSCLQTVRRGVFRS